MYTCATLASLSFVKAYGHEREHGAELQLAYYAYHDDQPVTALLRYALAAELGARLPPCWQPPP